MDVSPPLAALLIVPIAMTIEQNKFDRLAEAHPTIYETHINFTGHDLWLDTRPYASTSSGGGPDRPFSARRPERFSRFSRWPNGAQSEAERASFPYEGSRLKDGVNQYTYLSATNEAASSVPLHLFPYPDLTPLLKALGDSEASHLEYLYFHYPDHVEVTPSLGRLAGMTEMNLETKRFKGLVQFQVANDTSAAIARLEINGNTIDIGNRAIRLLPHQTTRCYDRAVYVGGALIDIDQPLTVRWQTLDAPQTWHAATVKVPAFKSPTPLKGESTLLSVLLYFLPDGTVDSERFVKVELSNDASTVRVTGLPERAKQFADCGGAHTGFNPERVRFLD